MNSKVIDLCCDMVRFKSCSGEEKDLAEYLTEFFIREGFDEIRTDDYGNVIARLKGNRPGKCIVFDGHMDIVPAGQEETWTYPPFGGEIHDGRIYGRGTTDMKGPLAACICGALEYRQSCGGDFPGDIYIACTVHEECFEGVASRGITSAIRPDYVVIAEPSGLSLKNGQKGRAEIQVETFGKAAHSSNPKAGNNAVYQMMEVIRAFRELPVAEDPHLGEGVLELTDIISSPYPGASVVPEYCRAVFDRRLVSGETRESILAPLQSAVQKLKSSNPDLKVKLSLAEGRAACYTGKMLLEERFFPAWYYDEDTEYIQAVCRELRTHGFEAPVSQYYFCTNGSHYGGDMKLKVLGFGPSSEFLPHIVDEYIEIQQLQEGVRGYQCIIRALLQSM